MLRWMHSDWGVGGLGDFKFQFPAFISSISISISIPIFCFLSMQLRKTSLINDSMVEIETEEGGVRVRECV